MKPSFFQRLEFTRRDFSRFLMGTMGSLWLGRHSLAQADASQPTTPFSPGALSADTSDGKYSIQYIRPNPPAFHIPAYAGVHFEDTVPDTLDIAERAKLGIHMLTSITDPRADNNVHWMVDFGRNPPVMIHDFNDWVMNCEGLMEALPLLRMATGSSLNDHVDVSWMNNLLRSVGPDGLIYVPLRGLPWSRVSFATTYVQPVWTAKGGLPFMDPSVSQVASPMTCERAISAMTVYYLRDGNPMWKASIEQMIQRLTELAVTRDDYAYLPAGSLEPNCSYGSSAMPVGFMGEETSARLIQGLSQYYKVTGYQPAIDLAGKLTRYIRFHAEYYQPDGPLLVGPDEKHWKDPKGLANLRNGGHGHAHGIGLVSVLEYASAVNDKDTLAFVQSGYEWMKANGCSQVGFFPEVFMPGYDRCESCTIADMIAMALKLSVAGAAENWDDADRWARNHFSESQMTDPEWVHRLGERSPAMKVAVNATSEGVAERNVGAFAGWSTGNDWVVKTPEHPNSIQHCCSGNCSRALYYLWQHILDYDKGTLRVNLLLNRASDWCDIHSYIPYEGRVDLKLRKHCDRILVRAPEWVSAGSDEVSCEVGGKHRPIEWQGRYLDAGRGNAGQILTLKFPIHEKKMRVVMGGAEYTLEIRGNTVISIDPPGVNGPLYERAHFRQAVQWRKVQRYLPQQTIRW